MFGWFKRDASETKHHARKHVDTDQYRPITKHYIFNETGNILLSCTEDGLNAFDDHIRGAFSDVSVFFVAMTQAMACTENPQTGKPFSIYNYQAIRSILNQSSFFVETNVQEMEFSSKNVGSALGKDFVEQILDRRFEGSSLAFTNAMFNGMSYQIKDRQGERISGASSLVGQQSGNLFFVCELLMGIPQISAILIKIEPGSDKDLDQKLNDHAFSTPSQDIYALGNKDSRQHSNEGIQRHWHYKKRTYLFIPPQLISSNAAQLQAYGDDVMSDLVLGLADQLKQGMAAGDHDD